MLKWILIFLVAAVICAALGFGGLAASFSWVAQLLAVLFAILFIVSIITGGVRDVLSGDLS